MSRAGISFLFILLLTALSLLINLSESYRFAIRDPFNKQNIITINIPGISPNLYLGPLGINANFSLRQGLDLQGGTSITLRADMNEIPESQREDALDSAKEVIERRINFLGVSEPVVQTSRVNNDHRLIVEIPGVTDVNQAVQLVGTTAKMTFWEAAEVKPGEKVATPSGVPLGVTEILGGNPKKTDLTGSDLKQAAVAFNPNTGKPEVQLVFTGDGSKKFADITKRNVGKIVAIALDNVVVEAPRVNEPIYGGNAVISGEFTTEQAKTLQIQLNAGALPVSLSVLQQQTVGASLGQESMQRSLFAGVLGYFIIIVFMIVLYGRLGVVASVALTIYTLLVLMLFRLIPVTLTLAGIAGFILSIGMAVDANILIFERMKEEFRRGRSRDAAVQLGFSRAWLSIRDSNISSLITSILLYYFGTGIVRGFAFTLALGVLVSMFSAIFVTKTFLELFYRRKEK